MFNTPALLMRAKKKESIFKDCWPLYNYSLKMIPELTEPIYVAPTTAQKTMQVVFQDKAPPIEVGVLHFGNFSLRCEKLVKIADPSSRVRSAVKPTDLSVVKHSFQSADQS